MSQRIFVTGATGFIGSAIVKDLVAAGHAVIGLVRSDDNARALAELGGTAVRGSLDDLDALRAGAEASDGVIHTAFNRDFANFAACCATDQRAIQAMGEVLAGSGRPFVVTTGTPVIPGRASTESDAASRTNPISALRAPAEDLALAFADRGVRTSVVRLPRSVHGASSQGWRGGLVTPLLATARAKGVSAYVGDGTQRWPAAHRLDVARAYCLAFDKARAGTFIHATAEDGVALRDIAEALGRRLGVPVISKTRDEATDHFGVFGMLASIDQATSSTKTQELLGWKPREVGLLEDIATADLS